ncbi:MAG: glycoside hydrolase family 3 N-terminal domain-containing protein [Bacteroidales bacterium]|nr:glycoside hydrolase family 3 N-terminal domain-containing protein [Bacteroidales bacterium]
MRLSKFLIRLFIVVSPILWSGGVLAQKVSKNDSDKWADSVMLGMSNKDKFGQLLMIRTYSNKDEKYYRKIDSLVAKYGIGGLTFFQGGPVRQAILINRWQNLAKIPLLISIDAENGLGMRLDSCFSFPANMTMGALTNDSLIYQSGEAIGKQCRRLGIHLNFAPVADINNNPANPVINTRSFGEQAERVADKSLAYTLGLQNTGVMATAKHFPGHGDTDSDSHYTLPLINKPAREILKTELHPFKTLSKANIAAVMVAHLFVPSLDPTPNLPSTLSPVIVDYLLRDQINFKGLIITDALDMQGITKFFKPGEAALKAFLAGNDILLLPPDIPAAIAGLQSACDSGLINQEKLDQSCRKILIAKHQQKLYQSRFINTKDITAEINPLSNRVLSRQIYQNATTLVHNSLNLLPFERPDTLKIVSISIGNTNGSRFFERLKSYFAIPSNFNSLSEPDISDAMNNGNLIVLDINLPSIYKNQNFGIDSKTITEIRILANKYPVILVIFGSPYFIEKFNEKDPFAAIIVAYENNSDCQGLAAQCLAGALPFRGQLPVSSGEWCKAGSGIQTPEQQKLRFIMPEEIGIPNAELSKIDKIVEKGIKNKAYPGCQVLLAKDGKVFYHKAFGHHTYDKNQVVKTDDVYDLASLTKIMASTPAVMANEQAGLIDLDEPIREYLPNLEHRAFRRHSLREIMAHQAGYTPWIPFYTKTLKNNKPSPEYYSNSFSENFNIEVSENLFLRSDMRDTIYQWIDESTVKDAGKYLYSDLGFIMIKPLIENITGMDFAGFLQWQFYSPLGLRTLGFKPLQRIDSSRIIPTEHDTIFRGRVLKGYVHDPAAAMLGGVSGHAGLFSDALDVAIMIQMYLWKGYYGVHQIIDTAIIEKYTSRAFPNGENRRGIGFDKPLPVGKKSVHVCAAASQQSFGHSGFTGTYTWADPENGLLYVFLSNRVYPDASNNALNMMNIRTEIHQAAYEILQKHCK